MARLPIPGSDSGNWGTILNDYLAQSHKNDGSIKDNAVASNNIAPNAITSTKIATDAINATQIADGSITETLLDSSVQTKLNQSGVIADGAITKSKLASSVQTTLDKADSALQTAPVTKVNNLTGDITLTKSEVGLSNIDNTADSVKPVSIAQQAALDLKAPLASPAFSGTPTGISKTHVGLANVDNTSDATKNGAFASLTNKDLTSGTNTFPTLNQSTTGNAATATKLATARNINGVAFDGSANITVSDTAAIATVTYSGSLGATRPTAPAVYWVGFPSTPTNVQSQDIVAAVASPKIISEYSGVTSLSNQVFPTSGGKSPTSVTVDIMIAPGTGGGSGRRGAAGTIRGGGGGGSSGGILRNFYIPSSQFGTSWSLTIPAAGTGGAAVTTNDTNGNNGGGGNQNMIFQTQFVLLLTGTGDVGYGGTATGGPGSGYGGGGANGSGNTGVAASATGGPGVSNVYYGQSAAAGGSSGGGITSGNVAGAGAAGGINPYYAGSTSIGAAGVVDSTLPTSGTATAGVPGNGAGSGAASITRAAQAAANAAGYGAGGAGGGASLNGFASGAGGNGGPGFIRIIWDYS